MTRQSMPSLSLPSLACQPRTHLSLPRFAWPNHACRAYFRYSVVKEQRGGSSNPDPPLAVYAGFFRFRIAE